MTRVSRALTDAAKRILHEKARVTTLHLVALPAVAFSYLATRSGVGFPATCIKSCGMAGVVGSIASWWPVAVSWLLVRNPRETTTSFRWWQVLFALVNITAVVGYLGSVASTLG